MTKKKSLIQRRAEREEKVKFDTAHYMQTQIDLSKSETLIIDNVEFKSIETEWPISEDSTKKADIAVLKSGNRTIFVIETKRVSQNGKITHKINPFAEPVIAQAKEYAKELKTEYYATFNGKYFVVFKIINVEDSIDEPILSLEVFDLKNFASRLLNLIAKIIKNKIKPIIEEDLYSHQLKSFLDLIYPQYYESLKKKILNIGKTSQFYRKLKEHMKTLGRNIDNEKDLAKMAKEAAYILIDKILFYQLLSKTKGYSLKSLQKIAHLPNFSVELRFLFQSIVDQINFKPIFSSGELFSSDINKEIKIVSDYNNIFDVPLEDFQEDIIEFIASLQNINLNKFDAIQLGFFFEKIIPIEERRELGQYYTPRPIIELINRLTIKNHESIIFDPACGSGGFLVGAYNVIKRLKTENSIPTNHIKLLEQIKGNDINRFPTHLSAIALAIQEIKLLTHQVEILNEDFFKITRSQQKLITKISTSNGEISDDRTIFPEGVDVIVMNPPYLRQEKINRDLVSKHLNSNDLKSILVNKTQPILKMDGRSDIYCYFITHAWQFLKNNGKIGTIISNRWLDTKYGEKFQKILLRLFKIKAIISFDRQSFEDPLIGSVIIILEKCQNKKDRENNLVKFLRIKEKKSVNEILNILDNTNISNDIDNEEIRLYFISQKILENVFKWSIFLFFNFELISFLNYNKRMTEITKYTEINMGIKSGANEFFFRKYDELPEYLRNYFTPLIISLGQVNRIQFNESKPQWGILNLRNLIEPIINKWNNIHNKYLKQGKMITKYQYLMAFFKQKHQDLYKYIKDGEMKKIHKRSSVKSRPIWFYLKDIYPHEIYLSTFYWRIFINPIKTNIEYSIGNQLLNVKLKNEKYIKLMAAWLNSNLIVFFIEILSRKAKGERLDRLQLRVYEAKLLPCLDFDKMIKNKVVEIERKWDELLIIDAKVNFRQKNLDNNLSKKQFRIQRRWFIKKYKLDILFLKFLFPIELFKKRELINRNEQNEYLKKCHIFYAKLWKELCDKYTNDEYENFIFDLLKIILNSNKRMVNLREKGGGEQRESLLKIERTPIEGADYYYTI